MTDLRITARCLEQDLLGNLTPEVAGHVVEVFVERRGRNPESGETVARVGGDRLWVRVIRYGHEGFTLTPKQPAAIQAAVFGAAPAERDYREGAEWDSIYLAGPIPTLDSWPPPERLV